MSESNNRKISFIIIFNHQRLDNLKQTIRFLEKRNMELLGQELVLVCQTKCKLNQIPTNFQDIQLLNMELETYHKPKMTNYGVSESKGDIIVLLDSDRVLTQKYFTRYTKEIQPKQLISTTKLYWLTQNYTDEEIEEEKNLSTIEDFKSKKNVLNRKNMFSGNTIMMKQDYLDLNGYDEKYIGYGYADNDMTAKCMQAKFNFRWLEENEYHLNHLKSIIWNNQDISRNTYKIISAINGLRYCKKWKQPLNKSLGHLCYEVEESLDTFPAELQKMYAIHKNVSLFF